MIVITEKKLKTKVVCNWVFMSSEKTSHSLADCIWCHTMFICCNYLERCVFFGFYAPVSQLAGSIGACMHLRMRCTPETVLCKPTTGLNSILLFLLLFLLCFSDPQTDRKIEEEEEEEGEGEGGDQTHGNLKREEEIQLRTEEEGNVCNQMISSPKATV